MLLSIAVVSTDASERYGKQLLSHLGRKVRTEPLPDRPAPAGRLVFAYGVGTVLPMPGQLILRATAANMESLARVQDVLQRHLEKFGARRELTVTWGPVDSGSETDATDLLADQTADQLSDRPAGGGDPGAEAVRDAELIARLDPERAKES